MAAPFNLVMGSALLRLILVSAGVVALWSAWNGLWQFALGIVLALAYLFYLSWRSVDVDEHLIDPRYWE